MANDYSSPLLNIIILLLWGGLPTLAAVWYLGWIVSRIVSWLEDKDRSS